MVVRVSYEPDFPIDKIIVKNRYRLDFGEIEGLMESIEQIGLIQPVTIDEDGRLWAGERRLEAHKRLGRTTIRADVVHIADDEEGLTIERDENIQRKDFHWTEAVEIEKAIFEFKKRKDPTWTQAKHAEARGISQQLVSYRLQLGEAFNLLPDLKEYDTQDEAWKEYKKLEEAVTIEVAKKSVPKEILEAPKWAKDHYRVGNCFDGMSKLKDEGFDFAEVDPPYAIDIDRRKSRNKDDDKIDDYNEVSGDTYSEEFPVLAREVYRLLKPNRFAIFWYGLQWHQFTYDQLVEAGFAVNPVPAIWYKGQVGQTAQPDIAFGSCYEPFFLARKGKPRMVKQGRSNVFHFAPVSYAKKIHITQKPIELLEDILTTILLPGSNVLVPFLGSGVTLRASYKLNHTGIGWDLSKKHKEKFLELVAGENVK